jgi:hypothetical protein
MSEKSDQVHSPAQGIMRLDRWPDADVYRVACSCNDNDHDVTAWIEVKPESDIQEVAVTFFVHGRSPDWRSGWNRWRAAWNLLWQGYHESEHTLLLDQTAAMNVVTAIQESVDRLQLPKSQ